MCGLDISGHLLEVLWFSMKPLYNSTTFIIIYQLFTISVINGLPFASISSISSLKSAAGCSSNDKSMPVDTNDVSNNDSVNSPLQESSSRNFILLSAPPDKLSTNLLPSTDCGSNVEDVHLRSLGQSSKLNLFASPMFPESNIQSLVTETQAMSTANLNEISFSSKMPPSLDLASPSSKIPSLMIGPNLNINLDLVNFNRESRDVRLTSQSPVLSNQVVKPFVQCAEKPNDSRYNISPDSYATPLEFSLTDLAANFKTNPFVSSQSPRFVSFTIPQQSVSISDKTDCIKDFKLSSTNTHTDPNSLLSGNPLNAQIIATEPTPDKIININEAMPLQLIDIDKLRFPNGNLVSTSRNNLNSQSIIKVNQIPNSENPTTKNLITDSCTNLKGQNNNSPLQGSKIKNDLGFTQISFKNNNNNIIKNIIPVKYSQQIITNLENENINSQVFTLSQNNNQGCPELQSTAYQNPNKPFIDINEKRKEIPKTQKLPPSSKNNVDELRKSVPNENKYKDHNGCRQLISLPVLNTNVLLNKQSTQSVDSKNLEISQNLIEGTINVIPNIPNMKNNFSQITSEQLIDNKDRLTNGNVPVNYLKSNIVPFLDHHNCDSQPNSMGPQIKLIIRKNNTAEVNRILSQLDEATITNIEITQQGNELVTGYKTSIGNQYDTNLRSLQENKHTNITIPTVNIETNNNVASYRKHNNWLASSPILNNNLIAVSNNDAVQPQTSAKCYNNPQLPLKSDGQISPLKGASLITPIISSQNALSSNYGRTAMSVSPSSINTTNSEPIILIPNDIKSWQAGPSKICFDNPYTYVISPQAKLTTSNNILLSPNPTILNPLNQNEDILIPIISLSSISSSVPNVATITNPLVTCNQNPVSSNNLQMLLTLLNMNINNKNAASTSAFINGIGVPNVIPVQSLPQISFINSIPSPPPTSIPPIQIIPSVNPLNQNENTLIPVSLSNNAPSVPNVNLPYSNTVPISNQPLICNQNSVSNNYLQKLLSLLNSNVNNNIVASTPSVIDGVSNSNVFSVQSLPKVSFVSRLPSSISTVPPTPIIPPVNYISSISNVPVVSTSSPDSYTAIQPITTTSLRSFISTLSPQINSIMEPRRIYPSLNNLACSLTQNIITKLISKAMPSMSVKTLPPVNLSTPKFKSESQSDVPLSLDLIESLEPYFKSAPLPLARSVVSDIPVACNEYLPPISDSLSDEYSLASDVYDPFAPFLFSSKSNPFARECSSVYKINKARLASEPLNGSVVL